MNILCKLTKITTTGLVIFIASSFLAINPVFAKNIPAGFAAGTMIATPTGEVAVEDLIKSDRFFSLNI